MWAAVENSSEGMWRSILECSLRFSIPLNHCVTAKPVYPKYKTRVEKNATPQLSFHLYFSITFIDATKQ
jgi:hypothetical protein